MVYVLIVHGGILLSILLAVDNSRGMDRVIDFAVSYAKWSKSNIYVLHIVSPQRGLENDKIIKKGILFLDSINSFISSKDVVAIPLLESGSIYDTIIRVAIEKKAKVIIMGNSTKIAHESDIGSVAIHTIHYAPCSVIVVR